MALDGSADKFRARAERVVSALVTQAQRKWRSRDANGAAWLGEAAARVACFAHTGRYVHPELEQLLVEIGQSLPASESVSPSVGVSPESRRVILHVATTLLSTGGHTRLLLNWIRNDRQSSHRVVLTNQQAELPPVIADALTAEGCRIATLAPALSRTQRAMQLRAHARDGADIVVLHTHQFDTIAQMAFADAALPPVALVNHSDHTFWLGSAIADSVVCIREFGARITAERRVPRAVHFVPIPLQSQTPRLGREEARAALGIRADEVLLITISARYKLSPNATHDFFNVAAKILASHAKARIIVIGFGPEEVRSLLKDGVPARLEFLGVKPDPTVYQAAADIYLEGFPVGSLTALLESVAIGAFPVLMYAPTRQLDISDDPGLASVVGFTSTAAEYVAHVGALVEDSSRRTEAAERARDSVRWYHMGEGWRARVEALYEDLASTTHQPRTLPWSHPRHDEEDRDRARWDAAVFDLTPLAALGALAAPDMLGVLRVLVLSVRAGDTRLHPRHMRSWASVLWRVLRRVPTQ